MNTKTQDSPKLQESEPLTPNLTGWQGVQVVANSVGQRFFGLDASRMIPMGAFAAIAFGIHRGAEWPAFLAIIAVQIVWSFGMYWKGTVADATSEEEQTYVPP